MAGTGMQVIVCQYRKHSFNSCYFVEGLTNTYLGEIFEYIHIDTVVPRAFDYRNSVFLDNRVCTSIAERLGIITNISDNCNRTYDYLRTQS